MLSLLPYQTCLVMIFQKEKMIPIMFCSKEWGVDPQFDFKPKEPHRTWARCLGMLDFEAGAKITGARFVVLKGNAGPPRTGP